MGDYVYTFCVVHGMEEVEEGFSRATVFQKPHPATPHSLYATLDGMYVVGRGVNKPSRVITTKLDSTKILEFEAQFKLNSSLDSKFKSGLVKYLKISSLVRLDQDLKRKNEIIKLNKKY